MDLRCKGHTAYHTKVTLQWDQVQKMGLLYIVYTVQHPTVTHRCGPKQRRDLHYKGPVVSLAIVTLQWESPWIMDVHHLTDHIANHITVIRVILDILKAPLPIWCLVPVSTMPNLTLISVHQGRRTHFRIITNNV